MPALLRAARVACVATLVTVVIAPGVAHADPEHRSDQAASHQPSSKPTPQGAEHRTTPQPPGQAEPKAHPSPAAEPGKRGASSSQQGQGNAAKNGDPAGNNGTIKIDYPAPADSAHANRPHPGCAFQLRMFNFDDDQYGSLLIAGQAPTKTGTLLTRRILLSSDPAGGGQDVDEVYSFSAADLGLLGTPQAKQGWHVKVAVNAENAPGGAKQKVFWLSCPEPASAASAVAAPRAIVRRPAVVLGAAELPVVVTEELTTVRANSASAPALLAFVGGGGVFRGGALPMTGVALSLLLAAAAAAIVLGAMALTASKRGPTRATVETGRVG